MPVLRMRWVRLAHGATLALVSRRLGQHFLRAASVERLLKVIDPRPHETFLEIAAGRGALTLPLASRAQRVVALELDPGLGEQLRERVPGKSRGSMGHSEPSRCTSPAGEESPAGTARSFALGTLVDAPAQDDGGPETLCSS